MSKKMTDWTDHLAGSNLPADSMTLTDASTYGLQGFQFDTDLGGGVQESPARLPETKGLSGLPDGFVQGAEEGLDLQELTESDDGSDLTEMLSEEEGGLPLTEEQKKQASITDLTWLDPTQDPDPERLPVNPVNVKPELEATWTGNRPPAGLVPNKDREIAQYEESIRDGKKDQLSGLPGGKKASGEEIRDAALQAVRLAHYGKPILGIKRELVARLGKDAIATRKVVEMLEQEHGLLGNVFIRASAFPGIRNGKWVPEIKKLGARYVITDDPAVANKLGMEMVDEVPWGRAYNYYAPRLRAAGYTLKIGSSKGNPKWALKMAFNDGPVSVEPEPTLKPKGHVMAVAKEPDDSVPVKGAEEQGREKKVKAALVHVAQWVKAGKMTQQDALKVYNFSKKASVQDTDILKMATDILTAPKDTPVYKGAGAQAAKERVAPRTAAPEFDPLMKEVAKVASATGYKTGEILGLLKWARQQMSEGMAGSKLDVMLSTRFSNPLMKAASKLLKEVRGSHEGLSGHLYVDAEAYASPSGTTGCDRGALKHRANALKYVHAMDRCAGCVHAVDEVCQKYNKKLASEVPAQDPKEYQKEALRLADAPDNEVTAALFNTAEYDLHNAAGDDIAIDPKVATETLSEVLFGGMEIGD